MKALKNKVAVITGAGSGIGRALAQHLAGAGVQLALNDYKTAGLEATQRALPSSHQVFSSVFDVSKEQEMQAFAKAVYKHYGQVDIMINNAGVAMQEYPFSAITTKDYDRLLNVNLWGTIYGCRAFLPYLRKQKESALVNISSVFGLMGVPHVSSYCVSKYAVRGLSESLYLEEKISQSGVHVSCVHPGGIKTNIARSAIRAEENPERIKEFEKLLRTSPQKAAKIIVNGIRKKKRKILVGPDAHLINFLSNAGGGLLRWGTMHFVKK